MRILLQFPEGLKQEALKHAEKYEREGHEVYLSASPCYGACDIALEEARTVGADKIVHFGHAKFVRKDVGIPVEYVEYVLDFSTDSLKSVLPHLKNFKSVAIGTTVQYAHKLKAIKDFFGKNGKKVFTGKGTMALHEGQILGCDAHAVTQFENKADAILFIGDGQFHYLAIDAKDTKKPVFVFHPKSGKTEKINQEIERLRKRRRGAIIKAVDARTFGIVISTKVGQFNMGMAEWAKKGLAKRGKKSALLVANEIEPLSLNNFMTFDCYIITACPRIADDLEEFGKPVLSLEMLKELFGILDSMKG